ncbi:MAG: NBR1-Ig-like domain-containing protein [Anaerolineales bacterium]
MLAALLSACAPNPPASLPTPLPSLEAIPIQTVAPAPILQEPTPILSTPTDAPRGSCVDGAQFTEDLSIPDGSEVTPGAQIDKRWSVENVGTCDWGPGYRLVRVSSDGLVGPDEVALYPARSGTRAVWQVVFTAPDSLGEFISEWQAQAPDGARFGDEVFVYVVVVPRVTPTASPLPGG